MKWTPLRIEILLHYHVSMIDFPRMDMPIWKSEVEVLYDLGMLQPATPQRRRKYKAKHMPTDKCHCFCEMLCDTPMPVAAWLDPRFGPARHVNAGTGLFQTNPTSNHIVREQHACS
jgi:hypothetical protein